MPASRPAITFVPVHECGEPLVDLRVERGIAIGPPPEHPDTAPDYAWVRRGIYERLLRVQASLPAGLTLRLYEGLRTLQMQARLFAEEEARIRMDQPDLTPQQVHERASLLISPVTHWDGTPNVPPHSTGAAIDVEIVDAAGRVIDFGMEAKDWVSVEAEYCETQRVEGVSREARANRLLLCEAMQAQGFVNYVREWWHYSFGDRYWAWTTGAPHAVYGPVAPPHGG